GEHDLTRTGWTAQHLTPYRVVNTRYGLAIAVQRLIHPADFLLDLLEKLLARLGKGIDIERGVVVGCDEGRRRRQIVEHDASYPPLRCRTTLFLPGHLDLMPVAGRRCTAPLCGHARHARTCEPVQHHVTRLGVVQDRRHDGQMRHLGVVSVRSINSVSLAY